MPHQARIDAPGALHHIICRGIDRPNIFQDNIEGKRFPERLGFVLQKTSTPCYGWALIPNHLLLKTNCANLSKSIQWLGITYTRRFKLGYFISGYLSLLDSIACLIFSAKSLMGS